MSTKEKHAFVPERIGDEIVLYDTHTKKRFRLDEFCSLIEKSMSEAFPNAELVECSQLSEGSRQFECRAGGYKLDKQEPYLVAQKAAYDIAEQFRLATPMFLAQLNGWSFVLEVV